MPLELELLLDELLLVLAVLPLELLFDELPLDVAPELFELALDALAVELAPVLVALLLVGEEADFGEEQALASRSAPSPSDRERAKVFFTRSTLTRRSNRPDVKYVNWPIARF